MTETYKRGTTTERVKTARITSGDQLLTEAGEVATETGRPIVRPTQRKTDAAIRTVESFEYAMRQGNGFYGRAQRTYTIIFTDGTRSPGHAPVYTWHKISAETPKEA
jgi:hypothetical protein